jgi:ABC-type multidrug transport system ATPase subunit
VLSYDDAGRPLLKNLSGRGCYVSGERLIEARVIGPEDLVFIAGFLLRISGRNIRWHDLTASRISVWDLGTEINGAGILKDISIGICPREFVGLVGPAGCGKSTLMDALCGLRPVTSGSVFINELDLYRNFDALRLSIGHVPQRDILHENLTVKRTLYYVARLRLPEGTSRRDISRTVDEVVNSVGLAQQKDRQFKQLSGGQRKRLNLAVELITKPTFIFLDEPTSPLDPQSAENMMDLFRRLVDEGRVIVMVTHRFEKFELMHQVAILSPGGRLAFFGPPREALSYFGCREPREIYALIDKTDPGQLGKRFKASPQFKRYVDSRIQETRELARATVQKYTPRRYKPQATQRRAGLRQWATLARRYLEVKLRDGRNTALLLGQAPIIGVIVALIIGRTVNDAKTLFVSALVSIWFGANNAVREIVDEAPIYARERTVNLKIPSYVLSKFFVLSGFGLVQCTLFVAILTAFKLVMPADFYLLDLILTLTSIAGTAMGLWVSAMARSVERALSILPLIIIPQLLFAGFMKPVSDIYVNTTTNKPSTVEEHRSNPTKVRKVSDGMSSVPGLAVAAGAIASRWSFDALVHGVSISDTEARVMLPGQVSVAEYRSVLDSGSEDRIVGAYLERVVLDLFIVSALTVIFLLLAMRSLRRKDVA